MKFFKAFAHKMLRTTVLSIVFTLLVVACTPQNTGISTPSRITPPSGSVSAPSGIPGDQGAPRITPTPGSVSAPSDIPTDTDQLSLSGELYFLLSTALPPFTYRCARIPLNCLSNPGCSAPEFLSFPTNNYGPLAPMFWTPDGRKGFLLNAYNSQLLVLEPPEGAFRVFIDDIAMVTGRGVGSPDGHWMAVSVQDGAYTSHITLIDPNSGARQALKSFKDQMQFPLGWLNDEELLVRVEKNQPIREGDFLKQEVSEVRMYKVNVRNGHWEDLGQNKNWLGGLQVLSPDKSELAFTADDDGERLLVVTRVDGTNERVLGAYGGEPVWSPDGKEIATFQRIGENELKVYVVRSDGTASRTVFQGEGVMPSTVWLPDSKHLLILIVGSEGRGVTNSLFMVNVTNGNSRPISIPGVDATSYSIEWLSVRPSANP